MKNKEEAIYAFLLAVRASEHLPLKERERIRDEAEKAMTKVLKPSFGNFSCNISKGSVFISSC
ncbi:MAG: hypothetical protein PHZ25_01630 [Candidatus Pacebacteria bacterium]|nr:hypothetical protein [Candidatus Paceibacterota bacterium]